MKIAASRQQPPDKLAIGFCLRCGSIASVGRRGDILSRECNECPKGTPLVRVRYQLARRMGSR